MRDVLESGIGIKNRWRTIRLFISSRLMAWWFPLLPLAAVFAVAWALNRGMQPFELSVAEATSLGGVSLVGFLAVSWFLRRRGKQAIWRRMRPHLEHLRELTDENVQFTVHRPRVAQAGKWCAMLVSAHKAREEAADLPARMQRYDLDPEAESFLGKQGDDVEKLVADSPVEIPQGLELRFMPQMKDVEFNPPERRFLWLEDIHRERFRLRASRELIGKTARGTVLVFAGDLLVAEITIAIKIDSPTFRDPPKAIVADTARSYRKIFASYSHKDAAVVAQVARFIRITGDELIRDRTHLRSGEEWEPQIRRLIDSADIFQLYWSWNAIESKSVETEWRYALSLQREDPFIRPFYWEEPLPAVPERNLPPKELVKFHFCPLEAAADDENTSMHSLGGLFLMLFVLTGAGITIWGGLFALAFLLICYSIATPDKLSDKDLHRFALTEQWT